MGQRSSDLIEKCRADDELELSGEPKLNEASRRAYPRDERGGENVGVENRPHALRASCLVLRLDGGSERLVLVEIGGPPDALEQIEPEIPPERFLDHVAVATATASCLHAYGAKNALVERDRGPRSRHIRIIALLCRSAASDFGSDPYVGCKQDVRGGRLRVSAHTIRPMGNLIFTTGLTIGSVVLAIWLDLRLGEARPESYLRRVAHAAAAFVVLEASVGALYYGKAHGLGASGIVAGVFVLFLPALVYSFLTGLWLMRTLAEVARLARR